MPEEWGYTPENMTGPIRGAALPMAFNRQPHYTRGLLLVGDAGGLVNPFNGEGIAYAMESGVRSPPTSSCRPTPARPPAQRELALRRYPKILKETYGGYYTLGRAFVKLIGNPKVMKLATERGLTHPVLMRFALKMLANLTDPSRRRRHGPRHQRPQQGGPARVAAAAPRGRPVHTRRSPPESGGDLLVCVCCPCSACAAGRCPGVCGALTGRGPRRRAGRS